MITISYFVVIFVHLELLHKIVLNSLRCLLLFMQYIKTNKLSS